MALDDMPEVKLPIRGTCKFILARSSSGKHYLYASTYDSHEEVFRRGFLVDLQSKGITPKGFNCVGGGTISVDPTTNVIQAYNKSAAYGKFDVEIVRSMLEKYVEEYKEGYSVEVE